MKIIATRFTLILGLAALILITPCVFRPRAGTALANPIAAQDPDRPVILGQVPNTAGKPKARVAHPELTIKQITFPPADDKTVKVRLANMGNARSGAGRLVLSVREINGVAVRTKTQVKAFSSLAPDAAVWLVVDAGSILPDNVSLESTNFKLNVYATGNVAVSDATEVRHAQLEFTAATPTSPARRIVEGYAVEFYAGGRLESTDPTNSPSAVAPRGWDPKQKEKQSGGGLQDQSETSDARVGGGAGSDRIFNSSRGQTASDSTQGSGRLRVKGAPDLRISEYVFGLPKDDKAVKVFIVADGQTRQTSRSGASFALVAASFKNAGGNYDNSLDGDKGVLVRVVNAGNQATTPCRLMLTVRKLNGAAVGRQKVATVVALAPGKDVWILVDAASILPNSVKLEATTFKLNVDSTELLAESNEANNEVWHNQ